MERDGREEKPSVEELLVAHEEELEFARRRRALVERYVDGDLSRRRASNRPKGLPAMTPQQRDAEVDWHLAAAQGDVVPRSAGDRKKKRMFREWLAGQVQGEALFPVFLGKVGRSRWKVSARRVAAGFAVVAAGVGAALSWRVLRAHGDGGSDRVLPDPLGYAAPRRTQADDEDAGRAVPSDVQRASVPNRAGPGDPVQRLLGRPLDASATLGKKLVLAVAQDGTATLASDDIRCRGAARGREMLFGCSAPHAGLPFLAIDEFVYLSARVEPDGRALLAEAWKPVDLGRTRFASAGVIALTPPGASCTLSDAGAVTLTLGRTADLVARVCAGTPSVFCQTLWWHGAAPDPRWVYGASDAFPRRLVTGCSESSE